MAESADKTPTEGAGLDEESEAVELTDEIGAAATEELEDIPDPETVDSMGLEMPEFKVPGDDEASQSDPSPDVPDGDSDSSASVDTPKTKEMYSGELDDDGESEDDADEVGRQEGDTEAVDTDEDGGDEPVYDRQEMVKTIQMEAFDREALEAGDSPPGDGAQELLADSRFAPEIIVSPPQMLVKKWREGLPGDVEVIVGSEEELETTPKSPPDVPEASEEDASEADASEADASEADASEADASEADASEADASEADAPEADASEADAPEADAPEADAPEADAPEADAPEADAPEADASGDVVLDEEVAADDTEVSAEDEAEDEFEEVAGEEEEAVEEREEAAGAGPETIPDLPQEPKGEAEITVGDEDSEPIELDDELVEFEEGDEIAVQSAPPPHREKKPTPVPPLKESADSEPASKSAEKPRDDDEMKGLVEELMEEEKQQRQKRRGQLRPRDIWFKEVFAEEYLRTVPSNISEVTRDEVDFIEASLRLKKKSRILDLACGFGRHSLELARRDYEMVGLDLSKPLLRHALKSAEEESLSIKFVHGDMRKLGFSSMFDGCFIWDTSLGYFDDRTNLAVLQGVHRAMKVGGRLLVDVINRDYAVQDTPTRLWWEGKGCIFLEESEFDYQRSILEVERSYIYEDGTPPLEHKSFIRLYSVHELRQMLHVAGFKVLEVSGAQHHKGYFLGASSKRIIVLAEKRKRRKPSAPGTKSNGR